MPAEVDLTRPLPGLFLSSTAPLLVTLRSGDREQQIERKVTKRTSNQSGRGLV
jgi:hypothetical protein